jgi:hypothetical protein
VIEGFENLLIHVLVVSLMGWCATVEFRREEGEFYKCN